MKNIVITGGSDGLGKAVAEVLSKNNNVIIVSTNIEKLVKVSKELDCDYRVCDVSKYKEVDKTIKNILEQYERIDILINNAGVWLAGDLTDNEYDRIERCIDVNTKGPIYMTKAVLPSMYVQGKGMVINVGSTASFNTDEFSAVYNASKWAVRGFTRTMTIVAAKKGVKVIGFYPGFMQTDLFKKAGNDYDTSTGLEPYKVADAINYIVNCPDDMLVTEFGVKDIENF